MQKVFYWILFFSLGLQAELRPEMQNLYLLADKMQNYSFNKKEFLNPKNEKEIAENKPKEEN